MTWARTADRYVEIFEDVRRAARLRVVPRSTEPAAVRAAIKPPEIRTDHLQAICDDTGLFQHCIYTVPDRSHGYCIDDNARALLLSSMLARSDEKPLPSLLIDRIAAFVQHAWNPDSGRFRNFLGFDRRWTEDAGSEDSHGRTLWALGACARQDSTPLRRRWADGLFTKALPAAGDFTAPRAWAFTLLGINAYCTKTSASPEMARLRRTLSGRLMTLLANVASENWCWFEEGLAYDNARIPQALIETGQATGERAYLDAGLRTLRWLNILQRSPVGHFRPFGTEGFGERRARPRAFDQQPLDATATIAASLAAWDATGDGAWIDDALRAFAWFQGGNDLFAKLVDPENGACRDGLHPDRPNENCGGESAVSYLLGLVDIRRAAAAKERSPFAARLA